MDRVDKGTEEEENLGSSFAEIVTQFAEGNPSSPKPMRYPELADAANFTLSPDKTQIAFVRQGDIWFASLEQRRGVRSPFLSAGRVGPESDRGDPITANRN